MRRPYQAGDAVLRRGLRPRGVAPNAASRSPARWPWTCCAVAGSPRKLWDPPCLATDCSSTSGVAVIGNVLRCVLFRIGSRLRRALERVGRHETRQAGARAEGTPESLVTARIEEVDPLPPGE